MKRGDVILFEYFPFTDGGEPKNKLLVSLNTPVKKNEPHLYSITTSQGKNKKRKKGCQPNDNLFFIENNVDCFDKDTWVLFFETIEYDQQDMKRYFEVGRTRKKFELKEQTINEISNCLSKSDDISAYHLSLLSKRGNR